MPKASKIKEFLASHELLRQIVTFLGVSAVCLVAELGTFFLLKYLLVNVFGLTSDANWFVFRNYGESQGGLGLLLAFVLSSLVAQVIAFILNRKKTFHSQNNLLWASCAYAVMVVVILIANAAVNGSIYTLLVSGGGKSRVGGMSPSLAGTVSKMAGGALSGIITFLASKFIIMRK